MEDMVSFGQIVEASDRGLGEHELLKGILKRHSVANSVAIVNIDLWFVLQMQLSVSPLYLPDNVHGCLRVRLWNFFFVIKPNSVGCHSTHHYWVDISFNNSVTVPLVHGVLALSYWTRIVMSHSRPGDVNDNFHVFPNSNIFAIGDTICIGINNFFVYTVVICRMLMFILCLCSRCVPITSHESCWLTPR